MTSHHVYNGPGGVSLPSDYVTFTFTDTLDRNSCMIAAQSATVEAAWNLHESSAPYLLQVLRIDGEKAKPMDYLIVLDKQNKASKNKYGPTLLDSWMGDYGIADNGVDRLLYGFILFDKPLITLSEYLISNADFLPEAVITTSSAIKDLFHTINDKSDCCIGGRLTPSHIGLYFEEIDEVMSITRAVVVDWSSCINRVMDRDLLMKSFLEYYKAWIADVGENFSSDRVGGELDEDIINPLV